MVEKKYFYNSEGKRYDSLSIHSGEESILSKDMNNRVDGKSLNIVKDYSSVYSGILAASIAVVVSLIIIKLFTNTDIEILKKLSDFSLGLFGISIFTALSFHILSSKYKLTIKSEWLEISKFPGFSIKYRLDNISECFVVRRNNDSLWRETLIFQSGQERTVSVDN